MRCTVVCALSHVRTNERNQRNECKWPTNVQINGRNKRTNERTQLQIGKSQTRITKMPINTRSHSQQSLNRSIALSLYGVLTHFQEQILSKCKRLNFFLSVIVCTLSLLVKSMSISDYIIKYIKNVYVGSSSYHHTSHHTERSLSEWNAM